MGGQDLFATDVEERGALALPQAVYIHIPFCTNKCYYCDFNSYVTQNQQLIWDYLKALDREMEETTKGGVEQPIQTIFVGGGTPTFLSTEQMRFFLESVNRHFRYRAARFEFSMEANPGTTDEEKLTVMRAEGVNRLSYGVQSFDPDLLKRIGRIHGVQEVLDNIAIAKALGYNNISIDLIFGLPGQTLELFDETLNQALDLNLAHYSAYSLKVEENTLFHVLYEKDQLILPPEDEEIAMYQSLRDRMKASGYRQYEISNFAKPGYESRHNTTYWHNAEYYGIGAGAHGYVSGRRHVNAGPVQQYIQLVEEKRLPRIEEFAVSYREQMEEFMIMGLRMIEGISLAEFARRYGQPLENVFAKEIEELKDLDLLEQIEGKLRLTDKGIPLGNEVFVRFLKS
jgi:oxygen-independent coproporphyrinogen-3 oxidase